MWGQQAEQAWVEAQTGSDARPGRAPCHVCHSSALTVRGVQGELAWVEAHTGPTACAARALYALLLRARAEDPAERISAADLAAGAYQILMCLLAPPAPAM